MKPKIMIVEDEPAIADTLQYALETDGFEPWVAGSALVALDLLAAKPFDLIILDIGLPDINGFELCKQIRATYTVPIIFLTARNDEVDRVVGLEIGGDDYVVKPFSPRELTARVKAVLRRSQCQTAPECDAATFQVNLSKRQITYFGQILDLSRYEYDILKTFISRPGHVYSRDKLMDAVWDVPEASMDRTVDAHIKNLRAKLKAVKPELDPIITHRGAGYALREDI
jgi:two-component system catabolic regulation response regulator CreB